ncbi:MAG: NADH-quinone oxidoreductase subunit L, partial [Stackebrandtia sp.]
MTRVVLLTFFGDKRWTANDSGKQPDPHEAPASMTGPMIVLAIGSVCSGAVFVWGSSLQNWLAPVVGSEHAEAEIPAWVVTVAALAVVAIGVAVAYRQYARRPIPSTAPGTVTPLTVAARRDLYGDAFNEMAFMRPGTHLTRLLVFLDNRGIDGIVNTVAAVIGGVSARIRRVQTGFVRSYALSMFTGAALVVAALLAVRLL